jgi:coenzyme F420-reducing hydrogenase alpha subunit
MTGQRAIHINVPVMTRVEGEGAMEITADQGTIRDLRLRIFEPPRYFEKFLEGRDYGEIQDIVARICGICPVAYQMSAVQAVEQAFGVEVEAWVREMRRVMYCGEWVQSHALHIHLLAAPDFLGYPNSIAMAADYPQEVSRGLRLQALGNDLIRLAGGRSVHPIGGRPGGFHRAPDYEQVDALLAKLRDAVADTEAVVRWTAGLDFPEDNQDFVSVAMHDPHEYAIYQGRLISDTGLDLSIDDYERHFVEHHEPHSTALFSLFDGKPYLVGPLARLNLNRGHLAQSLDVLDDIGIQFPSRNMFHSIVARALELHYGVHEAIRLLEGYRLPDRPYVDVTPRAGVGYGATEAPRGLLWHRYEFDDRGRVISARIVPPTSQNQARIAEDLRNSLERFGLHHSDEAIRLRGETVIRNYDPCISCATHFLKLKFDRG